MSKRGGWNGNEASRDERQQPIDEEIKCPSDPPPTARKCMDCMNLKDDSGETYGWHLCHCGSFRQPSPLRRTGKP